MPRFAQTIGGAVEESELEPHHQVEGLPPAPLRRDY